MGLGTAAAVVILLVAGTAAGTVFVTATGQSVTKTLHAHNEAIDRLRAAGAERITLLSESYQGGATDRVRTTWSNDGSEEILLSRVTVVVNGLFVDPDTLERFELVASPSSGVWAPATVLEVWVQGHGNADVGLFGPFGNGGYRRP